MIGAAGGLGLAGRVAQVLGQFRAEGPLNQRLLQLAQQGIEFGRRLQVCGERVQQLGVKRRRRLLLGQWSHAQNPG
jgi:hypothetical protein